MLIPLETDQTSCFDESGKEIGCLHTGQDGAVEKAGSIGGPDRFQATHDIVQDKITGLIWPVHANLPEFPLTWKEAFEFIQEINASRFAGINNWRLPSRKELFSLVSHQYVNPSLPEGHPFRNVFHGYYWTGTESARLPNQAWYVHLGGGKVYRGMKHGSYLVWPVSGHFADTVFMENRFMADGENFYDQVTQKTWHAVNPPNDGATTWKEAIRYVKKLNETREAGCDSWRLPNIRELESLVDDRNHSPAFADGFLPNKVREGYWSSTTSVYEPGYAWVLYTVDGAIGVGFKPDAAFFVLAVRG
jgi:hypothetical protein